GKRLWSYESPTAYRDDFGFDEGPRATPVIDSGRVYTFGAEGLLQAIDFGSGKKVWSVDTHEAFGVRKGFFGAAGAPLVEGNLVVANVGGRGAGIVAFDKNTGKVIWKTSDDEASYSSPVAATLAGSRLALFLTRGGLLAVDPASGAIRQQLPWRSRSQA